MASTSTTIPLLSDHREKYAHRYARPADGRETRAVEDLRRILVVHNPAAGRRRRRLMRMAIAQLQRRRFEINVRETRRPGDAEIIARHACEQSYDLIIAAGGDGTVNEVINGIGNRRIPIAVLPIGTANVLAAELGMPAVPAEFARMFVDGELQTAWPGEVNGRRFALMCSVGFDADVVARSSGWPKRLFGKAAYIGGACREWAAMQPRIFEIEVDGHSYRAAAAIIAKGRYYAGRFEVCPHARITAPSFEICIMTGHTRADILRYAVSLYRGTLHLQHDVCIVSAKTIAIFGPEGVPIQVDGDIRTESPATARVSPNPLQFLRPAARA